MNQPGILLKIEMPVDCRPAPSALTLSACGGNAAARRSRWRLSQLLRCPGARSPRRPHHHHPRQHTRPGQQHPRPPHRNAPRHPDPGRRGPKSPAGSRGRGTAIFRLRRSSSLPMSKAAFGPASSGPAAITTYTNGPAHDCGSCANLPRPPAARTSARNWHSPTGSCATTPNSRAFGAQRRRLPPMPRCDASSAAAAAKRL